AARVVGDDQQWPAGREFASLANPDIVVEPRVTAHDSQATNVQKGLAEPPRGQNQIHRQQDTNCYGPHACSVARCFTTVALHSSLYHRAVRHASLANSGPNAGFGRGSPRIRAISFRHPHARTHDAIRLLRRFRRLPSPVATSRAVAASHTVPAGPLETKV